MDGAGSATPGLSDPSGENSWSGPGRIFSAALRYAPDSSEIYLARGDVWRKLNKPDKAIADYTKAIELDPKCAEAYLGRGGPLAQADWRLRREAGRDRKKLTELMRPRLHQDDRVEARIGPGV